MFALFLYGFIPGFYSVLFNDIKLIMDRVQGRFYCNANEKS